MIQLLEAAELRRLTERSDGQVTADYRDLNIGRGRVDWQIKLLSRDHLTIRDIPDWSPTDSISVAGEVKFPGEYRIRKGETLSDVIGRAGGFTDSASPESAVFTRTAVAALEAERAAQFAQDIQTTFATRLLTEETTTQVWPRSQKLSLHFNRLRLRDAYSLTYPQQFRVT